MLDGTDDSLPAVVDGWLGAFERALRARDQAALAALFVDDSHWRDLVAFSWHVTTLSGAERIAAAFGRQDAGASGFAGDRRRTPPRRMMRAGREVIEAIFRFETATGRGNGVVRLVPGADGTGAHRAWTLMTALDEIKGAEEQVGDRRPKGESYARDFHGPNWLDLRRMAAAYAERDPAVLVIGGGQSGLAIAARLTQLGIDTLVVEREARIGDNWRHRYHALTLHNQVQVNHLPYMPFPPTWPTYIPKDKLAGWLEAYAEAMELNVWTGTEFVGGEHDAAKGHWEVRLRRADGTVRTMRPRHVILASGVSGIPIRPELPGLADFAGPVLHSSDYGDSLAWRGRKALVIGTGNSAHDIAQDLQSNGAEVVMVQRSPTGVFSVEPSGQLPYSLYSEGLPLEDCDLIAAATPLAPLRAAHREMTTRSRVLDAELLAGLKRAGFVLDEADETGWQFKYLERGGGYYFNVGCSDLIIAGKVKVMPFADIERFVPAGARLRDGTTLGADLVVLATGYRGQEALVRKLFGGAIAERVGPIWGFDPDTQELRNMWMRTNQPGLWFIAGSLAQCRIFSKFLALQIKACELGLISPRRETAPGAAAPVLAGAVA